MSRDTPDGVRLERWLAQLLHYGTWAATLTILSGLVIALSGHFPVASENGLERLRPGLRLHPEWLSTATGMHIMTVGVALFILLPVMRLILMLGMFLHQRDYRFSAIAALVLVIVAVGLLVGAA